MTTDYAKLALERGGKVTGVNLTSIRRPFPGRVEFDLKVVSEANQREHWSAKLKRKNTQQCVAWTVLCFYNPPTGKLTITLTRHGRRMDSDNLAGAFKHVRDTIAFWLQRDDGDPSLTWIYNQEPGKGPVTCEINPSPAKGE